MGLEPRVQLDVAGRSENLLVDPGATYTALTSYSGDFSHAYTILSATEKTITKRFTQVLLCYWEGPSELPERRSSSSAETRRNWWENI